MLAPRPMALPRLPGCPGITPQQRPLFPSVTQGRGRTLYDGRRGDADLGLSNLVAPLVDVHLLQQGRDDLPAGLGVLGQQHLELLYEILGDLGRERRI